MKIIHQEEQNRYVLPLENGLEAYVSYQKKGNILHLVYSEVPSEMRGKGVGKKLIIQTFEKLTEEGYQAIAGCSYIKAIANRDPKWSMLIKT